MRGEFVEVGGERLYYYAAGTRGSGDPALLLHGFPTSSHLWGALTPLLPQGRRYVVVDQLGCGRSVAGGQPQFSIASHADRVVALMDTLHIGRAALIAHGHGAAVAVALVRSRPTRFSHLALISPVDDAEPRGAMSAMRWLSPLLRSVPGIHALWLRRALADLYVAPNAFAHSAELYARAHGTPQGQRDFIAQLGALRMPRGVRTALGENPSSASIVWGALDGRGRETARGFANRLPTATLHEIPAAGHFVPEEAPEQLAAVLASYLTT